MAITYGGGKAGQHAKRKALKYTDQIVMASMIGMLVAGIALGLLISMSLQWMFGPLQRGRIQIMCLFVAIALGAFAVTLVVFRKVEKYTDSLVKERIPWLRGGQGEALVAWHLNDLPDTWHVFHNVKLWKDGDLDHVLIGPGGLFCISTKAHRGLYTVGDGGKYFLNREEIDHIREARRLAMELRDRLMGLLGTAPWIQPVLIAPFAYIDFQTFQDVAWVLHEGNLPDVFLDAKGKLKTAEIERYAKAVKSIVDNAPGK